MSREVHEAFHRTIASTVDSTPDLIYADYLQENGFTSLSAFIRDVHQSKTKVIRPKGLGYTGGSWRKRKFGLAYGLMGDGKSNYQALTFTDPIGKRRVVLRLPLAIKHEGVGDEAKRINSELDQE